MTEAGIAQIEEAACARQRLFARIPELGGIEFCRALSEIMDRAIVAAFEDVAAAAPESPRLALVATGGYGRRELAPHSDLDLTLIPLDDASPGLDALVRRLHRALHDGLGERLRVEIGYAYRLVNDAPALDGKSRTSMLDARLVAGDPAPFEAFRDLMQQTFPVGAFLIEKIAERKEAFARFHDTPLVVEPNVKEGAGGLRCLHTAAWIRDAIGEKRTRPPAALDVVLRARNLLHHVAGRKADVLSRQRQAEIADLIGRDPFEFSSAIAEAMETLHGRFLSAVEALHETRYFVAPGVQAVRGEARVEAGASLGDAALGIALATQLGLRVEPAIVSASGPVDGPEALHAIASGEPTLRNLDRCGLLAQLLPELTRSRTLMPDDTAHAYTVFEHTMRAVRNLDEVRAGSYLGDAKRALASLGPLYLALLLHDVGKAEPGTPHSVSGERIARNVCARWSLAPSTADLVAWLVREHLTMARIIRVRDVQNPSTAREFAKIVGDAERLDMLALLTYSDIRAVSNEAWSPAQESFLRSLRDATLAAIEAEHPPEPDPAVYRRRLQKELQKAEASKQEIEAFLDSLPAHYIVSTPPELVPAHMVFAKKAREGVPTVEVSHDPLLGLTDLTACCLDAPGLLSRLLAVLYAWDVTVEGLRVSTAATSPPVALDTFTVSFGKQPLPTATCKQVSADLLRAMTGELDTKHLLRQRGKDPDRRQEHFTYAYHEGAPGILEVQAPRGRGMAYRMSRLIYDLGWDIVSARFGQWAGRGAAAFYILSRNHEPLSKDTVEFALGALDP